ncbi:MAG: 16S rRNA (cytosine(1402)-N(4))-methyltransferase RsmH [Deltaproteobacteria bacterium]|nr:16S rRNA (cytosine(1402)-N(4))-methyltransferase RsmH [Deltaproteobacteria bacterium]
MRHVPVMVTEILQALAVHPGGIYVDATVGTGGHAEAILKATAPTGRVIGIDRDDAALTVAEERLRPYRARCTLIQGNFADMGGIVRSQGCSMVDGILSDLGMSSLQVDTAERGFSFAKRGPLDMRMDRNQPTTAAQLVNEATEQELAAWLHRYGEERFSTRVARAIVQRRAVAPFMDTVELAEVARAAIPAKYRRRSIDPATRIFQALRIVVNGELINIERLLGVAPHCLKPEGRLAVLSYHSLEDRLVKGRFRELAATPVFALVTKKPLVPSAGEVKRNRRARSAKLRVLIREP